ncbi:spore cortex biosynthesis protein YabQ [Thermovenabulum sp.]|uniref:spore cortex biosynthesis protein YabQ n=1 Tax=Thermovenabulum sp. TaxID=3100335 RepID=UPI003C7B5813
MLEKEMDLMVIIFSLFSGFIQGMIFDIYRRIRRALNPGKIETALGDMIFWILATLLIFALINTYLMGWVRGYFFAGFFTGFFIYLKTLSRFFIRLLIELEKGLGFIAGLPERLFKKIRGVKAFKMTLKRIKNIRRILKKIKK